MGSSEAMGPDTPSARSTAPLLVLEGRPRRKSLNVQFKLAKLRQRMWDKRQWKKAATAALKDVGAVDWFATMISIFALGWITALILLTFFLGISSIAWGSNACQPDGNFDVFQNAYNLWSASGFFQITLGWGRLSFADAKAIDVAWDIVFGRGGQALLASTSWRAFADYTAVSMQARPVTYQTFQTIFLQDQPGIWPTFYLARDFVRSRGLQSRVMMTIMVFVAVFILLFPTLGSAMTGYSANNDAYIIGYDGSLKPFSDFKVAAYVIHEAHRINMTGDVVLTYYAVRDVQKYGFYGLEDKESTWMGRSLPAPILNISATWLLPSGEMYGWNWTDPRTGQQPFKDGNQATYAFGNEIYPLSYVKGYGSCQPTRERDSIAESVRESYEWGFSYLQLFILITLLLVWTLCIAYMWIKARLTMRMRRTYDVPKEYKGVLELSDAIRKQLQESDPDDLSHNQLREEIKKRLGGGSIELDRVDAPETYDLWRGTWAYCKDEKWWLFAILGMLGPCVALTLYDNSFGWWMLVPILTAILAMLVGRSIESRCVLVLVGVSLGTVIFLGAWYGQRRS
ncbi:uncharacterized protein GLRG_04820 [Colletotrichum graminicola M1.001]|uniref:Uncharacterized protein n=1 Tax=Colletotrichum graminicola (strain M1.001 / M2 / FGSC 10212) TaxID=645133 RepID=E3QG80_COLGM|nr:uncharacterized protein GLRG_04820 [Colletotrichum graminicola M1.001]EFQ29676.1 hypothetical protein GLRG_04820 [Colletotrichum graminicola M1.001]